MRPRWRPLWLAAVLSAGLLPAVAEAQSFIVRGTPAGATVEVVMTGTVMGTGTADAVGDARVLTPTLTSPQTPEIVVHMSIDACGTTRRITLAERTMVVPPPGVGCERSDITGLFVFRRQTTAVIDITKTTPSVLLAQGPAPAGWLQNTRVSGRIVDATAPGLTLSGGVSFVGFRDVVSHLCGDVAPCTATDYRPSFSLGARYWITRHLAAEGGFVRSGDTTSSADIETGHGNAFDSTFNSRILFLAANFGGPVGRLRLYGRTGFTYTDAETSHVQTTGDVVFTPTDDSGETTPAETTIKSGTTKLRHRTGGWGFIAGMGGEYWIRPPLGIYVEGSIGLVRGKDLDGGEAKLEDRTFMLLAGARIYLGRVFQGRFLQ